MTGRSAMRDATALIIAACHQGHPPDRLKAEVLMRLQRLLPVDAVWWATSDPATLLFTQALRQGLPDRSIPYPVVLARCLAPRTATRELAPGFVTCSSRLASATSSALCCAPATRAGA